MHLVLLLQLACPLLRRGQLLLQALCPSKRAPGFRQAASRLGSIRLRSRGDRRLRRLGGTRLLHLCRYQNVVTDTTSEGQACCNFGRMLHIVNLCMSQLRHLKR
jgi:hypothetical protein